MIYKNTEPKSVHILINPKNSLSICRYTHTNIMIYACMDILTDKVFHIKCNKSSIARIIRAGIDKEFFISINIADWYQWGYGANRTGAILYARSRLTTYKNLKLLMKAYPEFFI